MSLFCSMLAVPTAADASVVTDGNGVAIDKHPQTGNYEISPDFFNGKVGFKKFQDLELSKGDIMNFIFQAYKLDGQIKYDPNTGAVVGSSNTHWDSVDTFVNFVNSQININGTVNALSSFATLQNAALKTDGNLVFVSPQGMIVGSSGVLNVGSLNVYTPTQAQFDSYFNSIGTADRNSFTGVSYADKTNLTFDGSSMTTGNAPITINGKVIARGDIGLHGSDVNITQASGASTGGFLLAGVGGDATVLTGESAANTLFNTLVNADNMVSGSGFANANGKIVITSTSGTNVGANSAVKNYAMNGSVDVTNTGSKGITVNGEISNANGTMNLTNKAGAINQGANGEILNKGTMNITNSNSGTGITLNGLVENSGDMNITNASGSNGLNIGGDVTNNTGAMNIHNQKGTLNVSSSGVVTSNGTSLDMENSGVGG